MIFRTDLALEAREISDQEKISGIFFNEESVNDMKLSKIEIQTDDAAKKLGKPVGTYITFEIPNLTDNFQNNEEKILCIAQEIRNLLPSSGSILVIGIGNSEITPDALGPKSANNILATRHISKEYAKSVGLKNLRSVSVISPGVLGQTGIEVGELIKSLVKKISPAAIIAIDALASKETSRLGCTIQISDVGITPGSGVGNTRLALDRQSLNIPVVSIGVPTVVDASTLAADLLKINEEKIFKKLQSRLNSQGKTMMVTPREIDLLIDRASKIIGMAINCALNPDYGVEDFATLVS